MRLLVACSPRAGGNSDHAATLMQQSWQEQGRQSALCLLREHRVRPCLGCGVCMRGMVSATARPACVLDPRPASPSAGVTGPVPAAGAMASEARESGEMAGEMQDRVLNGSRIAFPTPDAAAHEALARETPSGAVSAREAREGSDAAARIFDRVDAASALILVMPVFFYGPPAQAKALIDRAQVYWAQEQARTTPRPSRPGALLLIAGRTEGARLFEASELIGRCFLRALGFSPLPSLCLRGLDGPDDLRHNAAACARVRDFARTSFP